MCKGQNMGCAFPGSQGGVGHPAPVGSEKIVAKHYHLCMPNLRVQIVRFVDEEPQPGIVESQFHDADGVVHRIIDKVPLFTDAMLWSDSEYLQTGSVECKVIQQIRDSKGLNLARITIYEPWAVETTSGKSEFVIDEADLSDYLTLMSRPADGPLIDSTSFDHYPKLKAVPRVSRSY